MNGGGTPIERGSSDERRRTVRECQAAGIRT